MKYLGFALLCFIYQICFSQIALPKTYTSIRGKNEFKKQAQSENPNYFKAYLALLDEVRQRPNNAELHYFLGYTIDRMNANDGIGMPNLKKQKTINASEEFEKVNALEPIYKGEYIISDPYSKISGIWGSLAQAYLNRNMLDSAKWAFKEGKKRGGFIEPVLTFDRQLLNSCEKNSILITSGDNVTIGCWYLQTIEEFRTDITIVDASLINTSWYSKYLKSSKKLILSYTDYDIDTIDYVKWLPQQIEIINSKDTSQKLSWELRPTYMNSYLLKGDRILLDIFKNNYFDRPINFTNPADTSYSLFLNNHLIDEGLVSKVYFKPIISEKDTIFVLPRLKTYSIDNLKAEEIKKSRDATLLLSNFRWAYYSNIYHLVSLSMFDKAQLLVDEMNTKFSSNKLPYYSSEQEQYFKDLFIKVSKKQH